MIWLDADAAGHGWFIDQTPQLDEEFDRYLADSPANGKVDLLTAIVHEMGHHLGFEHSETNGFMQESLATGVRSIVKEGQNEPIIAEAAGTSSLANIAMKRDTTDAVIAKNDVSTLPQLPIADILFGEDGWLNLRSQKTSITPRFGTTRKATLITNDNDGTNLLIRTARNLLADDEEVIPWPSSHKTPRHSNSGAAFDDVDQVFAEHDRGRLIARRLRAATK